MVLPRYDSPDWSRASRFYRGLYASIRGLVKRAFRVHARGFSHVPREGGVIVAMNHFSWIDPVIAADVAPRPIFYLAKEELFDGPLRRRFFEGIGQIEVDRRRGGNDPALEASRGLLDDGCMVGIYVEGTRARTPEPRAPKRGVARLALATGEPVVPMALWTFPLWPKGQRVPRLGERVYVNVGEPMRYPRDGERAGDKAVTGAVAEDVMDRIRGLLDEAKAAHEAGERWRW